MGTVQINRELCVAINKDENGKINLSVDCYFSQTKFTNTKMKTVSGEIIKMNISNTTTQHGKLDPDMTTGTTTTVINANYDKKIVFV